jgi:hypothetical protein
VKEPEAELAECFRVARILTPVKPFPWLDPAFTIIDLEAFTLVRPELHASAFSRPVDRRKTPVSAVVIDYRYERIWVILREFELPGSCLLFP